MSKPHVNDFELGPDMTIKDIEECIDYLKEELDKYTDKENIVEVVKQLVSISGMVMSIAIANSSFGVVQPSLRSIDIDVVTSIRNRITNIISNHCVKLYEMK